MQKKYRFEIIWLYVSEFQQVGQAMEIGAKKLNIGI